MATFVADIWLGESDSFFALERATAAEAFADAMRLVGCRTAWGAFARLGTASPVSASWWSLPVTAFSVLRLDEDGEIDDGFRGVHGRYRNPLVGEHPGAGGRPA